MRERLLFSSQLSEHCPLIRLSRPGSSARMSYCPGFLPEYEMVRRFFASHHVRTCWSARGRFLNAAKATSRLQSNGTTSNYIAL